MIETVDPKDTAKLDEIDARVWCLINGHQFLRKQLDYHVYLFGDLECFLYFDRDRQYTLSRDALKSLKPKDWLLDNLSIPNYGDPSYVCVSRSVHPVRSPKLPTPELAELHAILQAIAHERG